MSDWLKELHGSNLAILFIGLSLLISSLALFASSTGNLGLEAIKLLGAGLVGFIGGKATEPLTKPDQPQVEADGNH